MRTRPTRWPPRWWQLKQVRYRALSLLARARGGGLRDRLRAIGVAILCLVLVWSAAQERWLEVSSVSNFETFQANRLKCRFKDENGKNKFVHTLNGSALALPRIVAALLENHQDHDGVAIPKALVPYVGFERIDA